MRHWYLLAVLATVACGGAPAPSAPPSSSGEGAPAPVSASPARKAKRGSFQQVSFPCCGSEGATAIVTGFSDLGTALAADDAGAARTLGLALSERLVAHGPAVAPSADVASVLASGAQQLSAAEGLDGLRAAYLSLSDTVLEVARASGPGGQTLAVGFCPMKPGRWIQGEPVLANPYYGAEMLRCGTFEELVRD